MYNLIRKDIILQKYSLMVLLPLLLIILSLEVSYIWPGFIFSISIIMNVFTTDEKSPINTLLVSLPYTRSEIVSSKYIGVIIFTIMIVLTIFIGNLIINKELTSWKEILFIISSVMVVTSFMFPFSYQFKSQYLMIGTIVLFVAYLVMINTIFLNINDVMRSSVAKLLAMETLPFFAVTITLTLVLFVSSWLLSLHIFRRKAF